MPYQLIKNSSFAYTSLSPSPFSYFLPILYSLFNAGIICVYPNMDKPAKHVLIMSMIGATKGVTIDHQKNTTNTTSDLNEMITSYGSYAVNGAIKSGIKFGVRALCSRTIEKLGVDEYISKPLCTSVGGFASHIYSNGFEDIGNNTLTSILTIPSNALADIARNFLEPNIDDLDQTYDASNLYGIANREFVFFPSNLVHSLIMDLGKVFSKSLLKYTYMYINKVELDVPNPDMNASNPLVMNTCQAEEGHDLVCYINVAQSYQQDPIDINLFE